jgi:hypothetical protein
MSRFFDASANVQAGTSRDDFFTNIAKLKPDCLMPPSASAEFYGFETKLAHGSG